MSMGQGGDYLKYHEGQHGGALTGAPVAALGGDLIDPAMRGPAHLGGLDAAFRGIAGLKDQAGGRRKKGSRKNRSNRKSHRKNRSNRKSHCKNRKSTRRNKNRSRRSRGGALGYAPFPSGGMLLKGDDYARAGLNPSYINGGIEAEAAHARSAM
jgi:hypothetical protein